MLKLDINLLWTVVNVLIMYALLRKFLFKPVQDVLDKRQKMVDDELANAQDAKTKAEAALAAANDKLHNVDVEAAARREESAQQAENRRISCWLRHSVRPTPSWPRARQLQKQSAPASCARPTHRSPT